MNNWLYEDEDDIFVGSPRSKYFEIAAQANSEIVQDEFDKIVQRFAVMECLLDDANSENIDLDQKIKQYALENSAKIEEMKKGLYIEFTGDIVCRLDS
jgi:hypothetical protein